MHFAVLYNEILRQKNYDVIEHYYDVIKTTSDKKSVMVTPPYKWNILARDVKR